MHLEKWPSSYPLCMHKASHILWGVMLLLVHCLVTYPLMHQCHKNEKRRHGELCAGTVVCFLPGRYLESDCCFDCSILYAWPENEASTFLALPGLDSRSTGMCMATDNGVGYSCTIPVPYSSPTF